QRLLREVEERQWEIRSQRRKLVEREEQLREVRAEAAGLRKRCQRLERGQMVAEGELRAAQATVAAQRRGAEGHRAEVRSLQLRLAREAEERSRQEAEAGRARAAAAAAESEAAKARAEVTAAASAAAAALVEAGGASDKDNAQARAKREVEVSLADERRGGEEIESLRCSLATRGAELAAVREATEDFVKGRGGFSSGGSGALDGALAAVTEARRARLGEADQTSECRALLLRVSAAEAESAGLRERLEELDRLRRAAEARVTDAVEEAGRWREGEKRARGELDRANTMGSQTEAALEQVLAGAAVVWGKVLSALLDVGQEEGGPPHGLGEDAANRTIRTAAVDNGGLTPSGAGAAAGEVAATWQPESDPGLKVLGRWVGSLVAAYRRRGVELKRARLETKAKGVCAREARRREGAAVCARAKAEERLEECLARLQGVMGQCREEQAAPAGGRAPSTGGVWGWGAGEGGGSVEQGGVSMSPEQAEHIRQIKEEVDRLQGQNQALQLQLVGHTTQTQQAFPQGWTNGQPSSVDSGQGNRGGGGGGMAYEVGSSAGHRAGATPLAGGWSLCQPRAPLLSMGQIGRGWWTQMDPPSAAYKVHEDEEEQEEEQEHLAPVQP
ncbi:unnamed protein product, partial [Discosporangium mesarthrocarpum]